MTNQSNIDKCQDCKRKKQLLNDKHSELTKAKPNTKKHAQIESEIKQLTDTYRTNC